MNDNTKPLGKWTLAEVKEYCFGLSCERCRFFIQESGKCKLKYSNPAGWDLTELPRWTEQEVEDAKALLRLLPSFTIVARGEYIDVLMLEGDVTLGINPKSFPSLKRGENAKLREIAECKG